MTKRGCLLVVFVLCLNGITHASASDPVDPELRALLQRSVSESTSFTDRFDAEVWLSDMSNRLQSLLPDHDERLELLRLVHREARRASLHPELVLALIETESHFQRFAISNAGAQGLMQIMPFWLDEMGRPDDNLFISATNLRYGCTILKYYLGIEKGDLARGLARYNGSLGKTVYSDKVLNTLREHWYQ